MGPFGLGGSHNYNIQLNTDQYTTAQVINVIEPNGAQIPFSKLPSGVFIDSTMPISLGNYLTVASDDSGADLHTSGGSDYHFITAITAAKSGAVLDKITDRNGNVTNLVWERNSANFIDYNLISVTDPIGRSLTFTHDSSNRITSVIDPIGRIVTYEYNADNTLASVTDANGGVTQYAYSKLANTATALTSITDPRGHVVIQDTYDDNGRVISQKAADGGVTTFAYTPINQLISTSPIQQTIVTDPLGRQTTYRFNPQGFLVAVRDPSGQTMVADLDPGTNQPYAIRNGASPSPVYTPPILVAASAMESAAHIHAAAAVKPLVQGGGGVPTLSAHATPATNAAPGDQTFTYDTNGNILTQTDALGNTTTFTYDPVFNNVTSITDPLGHQSTYTYDSKGNLLTASDANGKTTTMTYNANGQVVTIADPLGKVTTIAYGPTGDATTIVDPLGRKTTIAYDGASRPISVTDQLGRTSRTTYDALNRVISQADGLGHTVDITYDADGNVLSLMDPLGHSTTFTYDNNNRQLTRTSPTGKSEARKRDPNGQQPSQFTDRRGQVSNLTYDDMDRLSTETYQDGSSVSRTYDAFSRLLNIADTAGGSFVYSYDLDDRLIQQAGPTGAVAYTFDAAGELTSRDVSGQPGTTYAYDPAGQVLSATLAGTGLQFTYNGRGEVTGITRTNGISSAFTYDDAGQLTAINHAKGATSVFAQAYSYSTAGQRVANCAECGPAPFNCGCHEHVRLREPFDPVTVRTQKAYDADGNLVSETGPAGTTAYAWDSRGRITSITRPDGSTLHFVYDPSGNVISQTDSASGVTRSYVLDSQTNVVAYSDSNAAQNVVLTGLGVDSNYAVLGSGGTVQFGLTDALGSTTTIADASGAVKGSFAYEPLGATTASGAAAGYPFQYIGRIPVANNLYYFRARFYNTTVGRFISEDPLGFAGGINLYGYALDDPLDLSDPSGEFLPLIPAAVIAGFVVGAGVDIATQYFEKGSFGAISWKEVLFNGATGALGAGLGVATLGLGIGAQVAINAAAGAGLSAANTLAANFFGHKCSLTEGLGFSAILGGIFGAGTTRLAIAASSGVRTALDDLFLSSPLESRLFASSNAVSGVEGFNLTEAVTDTVAAGGNVASGIVQYYYDTHPGLFAPWF